jgi:TolA-binding protein
MYYISVPVPHHEVTSTGQSLGVKRPKTTPMPINLRSSTNDDHNEGDDQRKKQIRDSNREAARRCRERRRQYIEQLEGNLEQCKSQIKSLSEKLSRAERENNQLHTIITETKMFHPSSRLSSNEAIVDFANVISTTNGMDLHSETTDGNTIQRNFINRNTR